MKYIYPKNIYKDGEPCFHKTCYNHIKTPCDKCGRVGMVGDVDMDVLWDKQFELFDSHPENPLNILFPDRPKMKRVRSCYIKNELINVTPIPTPKFKSLLNFFKNDK